MFEVGEYFLVKLFFCSTVCKCECKIDTLKSWNIRTTASFLLATYIQHKPITTVIYYYYYSGMLKTPELQTRGVFQTPPSLSSIQVRKKSRLLILPQLKCVICEDPLTMQLAGEMRIELTCGHICHLACFNLVLPLDPELSPTCPECECETRCILDKIHNQLFVEKICETSSPSNVFSNDSSEYTNLEIRLQSYSPPFSPKRIEPFEIAKPVVELSSQDNSYELHIKSPECYSKEELCLRQFLPQDLAIKEEILEMVEEKGFDPDKKFGQLTIFDYLVVTVNGREFGEVEVYLFSGGLLLVKNGCKICFIHRKEFSSVVQTNYSQVTINLTNDMIPEIVFDVSENHLLIISKWIHFLKNAIRFDFSTKCSLITSNGWGLVSPELRREVDITSTFVPLDTKGANLILCMNLVNTTSLENSVYKCHLQKILRSLRENLRPIDNLGLVFIGVDSSGRPCPQSTLMGYSGPDWEGWKIIIDGIEVFSNNYRGKKIFTSYNNEEVILALKKAKNLLPFMDLENRVNKLVIPQFSNPGREITNTSTSHVMKLLEELAPVISITFVTPPGLQIENQIKDHFKNPIQAKDIGCWQRIPISIINVTSFDQLSSKFLVNLFQNIYIPKLNLKIKLDNFEMGEVKVANGIKSLNIIVHDIDSKYDERIKFCTQLNPTISMHWLDKEEVHAAR